MRFTLPLGGLALLLGCDPAVSVTFRAVSGTGAPMHKCTVIMRRPDSPDQHDTGLSPDSSGAFRTMVVVGGGIGYSKLTLGVSCDGKQAQWPVFERGGSVDLGTLTFQ